MTKVLNSAQISVQQHVRYAEAKGLGSYLKPAEIAAMLDGTVSKRNVRDVGYARLGALAFGNHGLARACDDLQRSLETNLRIQGTFATLWEGVKDAFR